MIMVVSMVKDDDDSTSGDWYRGDDAPNVDGVW